MRRYISRIISRQAHRDLTKSESINILNPDTIAEAVKNKFGWADWSLIFHILRGEVLSDSRGEGSLQRVQSL